ncbi:MFS transporter [Nocardiopsis ansamitocini]|uniref:MFS transporter n=2 Tax=Nocardiopsis ansamitocini TaxID=1670832 RepID=A0A9W6P7R6_9ACTN|nr:MFS transporter [Nocardiopsis ansamitocini]
MVVSGLGDGIRTTALAVFAAALTRDPVQVAMVTLAGKLPWACVGPFAGVLVDRVDRWRALWICDVVRVAVLVVFVALMLAGQVGVVVLAIAAFSLSSVQTMSNNLSQAVVPDVADKETLDTANSRILGGQFVTVEFVGAPLGTALFVLSEPTPFVVDALSFVVSAVLVFSLRTVGGDPARSCVPLTPAVLWSEMVFGVRWLWRHQTLRTLCLLGGVLNFAVVGVLGIAVLYALEVLRISQTGYGLLLAFIAVGGLVGLLVAPGLVAAVGRGRALKAVLLMCPVAFLVGGVTTDAVVAATALAFVGVGISVFNVVTATIRQTVIPAALFGRVNGAYRFVGNGLSPLGALAGGLVADGFGLRAPFFVGAFLLLTAVFVVSFGWPGLLSSVREARRDGG